MLEPGTGSSWRDLWKGKHTLMTANNERAFPSGVTEQAPSPQPDAWALVSLG